MKRFFLLILLISNFVIQGQKNIYTEIDTNPQSRISEKGLIKNSQIQELERFKKFKRQLDTTYTSNYLEKIRNYSKDSLKTLAIKLISIRELQEKKLLKKDIKLNVSYYINLLDDLKSSQISVDEYYFLEQELAYYSLEKQKNRLLLSMILNIIFFAVIVFFSIFVYIKKKNKKLKITEELSKQEYKIKEFIVDGKSNKEIAEELFISLNTVKTHITNIYNKLNVSNRRELIVKFKK